MRRTSFNQSCRPTTGRKANQCLIFPFNQSATAIALERRKNCWFIQMNVMSDLIVNVDESMFHLHKVPLISKSEFLNRLVFQRRNKEETNAVLNIQIENLPGGTEIFELVVKFCYGLPIDLSVANVAPLYCAAHFLQMNEDFEQANLISKTETFLSFIIFSSWKDTIQILKSCETVSSCPEELKLVKRCSESIAWKASLDPKAIFSGDHLEKNSEKTHKNNNGDNDQIGLERWWFKDVSVLRIDHFVEFINTVKMKKMGSSLVGSCIVYWASKNLSTTIKYGIDSKHKEMQRVALERLNMILPIEENSVTCSFLLHLLKVGLMINIDLELTKTLEQRVAMMLETCSVGDLIVKNYGDDENVYDVSVVVRVVKAYMKFFSSNSTSSMYLVAKVVDEYLLLVVARDNNLSVKSFTLIAEALPENARYCNDKLYTAIDMYLKSHPTLTEEERRSVCKFMDYHKLSLEARDHAMKNDRLPLNIMVQFILLEQVNMTRSILAIRSNFARTKSQAMVRRNKLKRWLKANKELVLMKKEIEKMKVQLNDLQTCRGDLRNRMENYLAMSQS